MSVRNLLLIVAVSFFVIAFLMTPDGCVMGYTGDPPDQTCEDPNGLGQLVSQVAHLVFAGLAILSAALIDYVAVFRRSDD